MATVSVIQEYCVLYSDRLVQRDKKWVDGILKYYEFNNKIEILTEDGVLVKSDFKKINFEVNKQYKINNMIVEVLEFNGASERDILMLFKKELSQSQETPILPVGNRQAIPKSPVIKNNLLTGNLLKSSNFKIKKEPGMDQMSKSVSTDMKRRLVGTKIARAGLTKPAKSNLTTIKPEPTNSTTTNSIVKSPKPETTPKPEMHQTSAILASSTSSTASSSMTFPPLKFRVIKPIVRRIPPRSTKIYRFIQ